MSGNLKVLSFHDVLLRQRDVDTLLPGQWLNDNIIEFFLTYLQQELLPACDDSSPLLLAGPSLTFWLMLCHGDDLRGSVKTLDLPSRKAALFVINNNSDPDVAEAGSHWSTLVLHRPSSSFLHADSSSGINRHAAEQLARILMPYAGLPTLSPAAACVRHIKAPQQSNGSDCGLYCLEMARRLCVKAAQEGSRNVGNEGGSETKEGEGMEVGGQPIVEWRDKGDACAFLDEAGALEACLCAPVGPHFMDGFREAILLIIDELKDKSNGMGPKFSSQ